jgi:apolipoprotein N-acyltransferase
LQQLKRYQQVLAIFISFFIVAFGQPASIPWLSLISAIAGYAIFCRVLLDISSRSKRFWLGTLWFTAIQAVQLSWLLTHPFNYIYSVYAMFCILCGLQWGVFSLFITPRNVYSLTRIFALAGLWTLLEWSRFFFFSGYTWNPAGIALSENLYSLQFAAVGGVFLLSFWVLLSNMLGLRAWLLLPRKAPALLYITLAAIPYLFGIVHLNHHLDRMDEQNAIAKQEPFKSLLVQTAFEAEEAMPFPDKQSYIAYVLDEWVQVLKIIQPHFGKQIDLIALPEYIVPFGTYNYLYPSYVVAQHVKNVFGASALKFLPPLEEPFARPFETIHGQIWFVNNAYWVQTIANIFQAEVVVGLEDSDETNEGLRKHYSAALHFKPNTTAESFSPRRYAKRVLIPMAEYIPFSWLQAWAAEYGIQSSFTPGDDATIFQCKDVPFGISICYEETFGNLMRECRAKGAELIVNLTSDVWYPNSNLPKQHFDHARLRTVENGIPLLRACNTGVTSSVDSLGRIVATLGDTTPESQWISEALYVETPRYHYNTLYSRFGDLPIIILCCLSLLLFLL